MARRRYGHGGTGIITSMDMHPCAQCATPMPKARLGPKNLAKRKFCNQTCESDWYEAQVPLRFWAKVNKTPGCWEWTGTTTPTGYGRTTRRGQEWYTHRLAWAMENGPIPDRLQVMHICDNPPCVRPDHLTLGTFAANMQDKHRKGRAKGSGVKGSRVGTSKLTEGLVAEIRLKHSSGSSIHGLARAYGVTRTSVRRVVNNESWRHVGPAYQFAGYCERADCTLAGQLHGHDQRGTWIVRRTP